MWLLNRFGAQYSLITIIEKWRKKQHKGKSCTALLTDLSKVFDCIVYDFLIAKLEAYGFSCEAIMHNYLTDRCKCCKCCVQML